MKSFGGGFRRSGSTIDSGQLNNPTSSIAFTGASKNPWEAIMNQMKDNVRTQLSMQNFLNAAGNGIDAYIDGTLGSAASQIATFDTSVFDGIVDTTLSTTTKQALLKNVNITGDHNMHYNSVAIDPDYGRPHRYENPFQFNSSVISSFNNYRFIYKEAVAQEGPMYELKGKSKDNAIAQEQIYMAATPSLFNINYAVPARQLTPNVPNVFISKDGDTQISFDVNINSSPSDEEQKNGYTPNDKINVKLHTYDNGSAFGAAQNITDCSIKELVSLSKKKSSILGAATYRYADFMYCKDLGKVSNNHLITLRKYAHPVGDDIFHKSHGKNAYRTGGAETGKLVTWFGTGENSLEDILKYDVEATWKKLTAEIQQIESQEDDSARGPLGKLINTLGGGSYNRYQAQGFAGQHSLLSSLGAHIRIPIIAPNGLQGAPADLSQRLNSLRNYDKNKVYEPKNRIWDTHTYEGRLIFTHEFTLKFSYTLRSYDNVNPKAAFLDLLGNILRVTYKDGKFWGGSVKMIGPPQNRSAWNKANHMIDQAWDKVGGFMDALFNGEIDFGKLLGSIANTVQNIANAAKETAQKIKDGGAGELISKAYGNIKSFIKSRGIDGALKGMLKNTLGRPAVYTMSSILTGEDVGLWHVTIGNPKNPIAAFGNLILTKASIQHSGPLGVDDFPTQITVTCTLKHARSRDARAISRMYTRGSGQIYMGLAAKKLAKFYKGGMDAQGKAIDLNSEQATAMAASIEAQKEDLRQMREYNEKAKSTKQGSGEATPEWDKLSAAEQAKYKDKSEYDKAMKEKADKDKAATEAAAKAQQEQDEKEYAAYKEKTLEESTAAYKADMELMKDQTTDYFADNGEYAPHTIWSEFATDNMKLISGGYIDQNTI